MAEPFADITMKELDDSASRPSGQGALMRLVLRLSRSAPAQWCQYFNQAWQQHLYGMKRRATVSGDRLEIVCMQDELEQDHLPELKKVIAETNVAYRAFAAEQQRIKEANAKVDQQQKEELASLKGRLKFD